jgi:soluble lytic murein transglycosylase-like protein
MHSCTKTSSKTLRSTLVRACCTAAICASWNVLAGVSFASERVDIHFFNKKSQDIALEQALRRAATNNRLAGDDVGKTGENLNLDDLVWLANMSERLVKRVPDPLYRIRLLKTVLNESRANGLDPQLVLALIDVESSFQRDAVSKSGAAGLMQVMPFWLDVFDKPEADLSNPLVSLRFGCKILRHYMDRYDNVRNALAAYNGSVGSSIYPDRITQRYHGTWRYWSDQEVSLSLGANTKPSIDYETAKNDSLGILTLPANQIALTFRPAPIVVEHNAKSSEASESLKVADNLMVETSFYGSQAGQ